MEYALFKKPILKLEDRDTISSIGREFFGQIVKNKLG